MPTDAASSLALPAPVKLVSEAAFALGPVHVDPAQRRLSIGGRSRSIEPRAMQVLVVLARAEGAVVSRDALVEQCWNGRAVSDDAIYRVISQLRALGSDFAAGAFQIETISKVGYRLVQGTSGGAAFAAPTPDRSPDLAVLPAPDAMRVRRGGWTRRAAVVASIAAPSAYFLAQSKQDNGDPFQGLIAQSENAWRMDTPDSDSKGIGFLQEAVALEPSNPQGWGRLALAYTRATEYAPAVRVADLVFRAQEAADRALALDQQNADAKASKALLPPYFGEWYAAEARLTGVLVDHPGHLITLDARDFLHSAVGRTRQASQSRLAYARREPLHARIQYRLVYAYWNLGMIGDADRAAERALQLWPAHPGVWFARLWLLAFTGRAKRALRQVDDEAGQPNLPPDFRELLRLSLSALEARSPAASASATAALLAALEASPSVAIQAVMVLADLGELDAAFAIAEAYLLERGPLLASLRWREGQISINDQARRKTHMLFVPPTARMRADPRFKQLTEELGLASYWRDANLVPDFLRAT